MTPDPVRLYSALASLRHVRRFARQPVNQPQSVADHCYYTAMLAACFAQQIAHYPFSNIQYGVVVEAALWHDAAESFTSDLPHDVKRWSNELHEMFDRLEKVTLSRLSVFTGVTLPWPLRQPESLEARVVKIADCAELLFYVRSERALGNSALDVAFDRISEYLMSAEQAWRMRDVSGWYADVLDSFMLHVYLLPEGQTKLGPTDSTSWGLTEDIKEGGDKG